LCYIKELSTYFIYAVLKYSHTHAHTHILAIFYRLYGSCMLKKIVLK